jgi:hypothetical protein
VVLTLSSAGPRPVWTPLPFPAAIFRLLQVLGTTLLSPYAQGLTPPWLVDAHLRLLPTQSSEAIIPSLLAPTATGAQVRRTGEEDVRLRYRPLHFVRNSLSRPEPATPTTLSLGRPGAGPVPQLRGPLSMVLKLKLERTCVSSPEFSPPFSSHQGSGPGAPTRADSQSPPCEAPTLGVLDGPGTTPLPASQSFLPF